MPVATATTSVKTRTRQSSATSADRGTLSGIRLQAALCSPTRGKADAQRPAKDGDDDPLGDELAEAFRSRLAPSAARTANSRRRESARASSRFARFAHAIRSTNPTAPWSTQSDFLTFPTMSSWRLSIRSR